MRMNVFELILESIDVDKETIEKRTLEKERFIYIEAVQKDTYADITYLIYLCCGEYSFSYDEYKKVKKEIEQNVEMNSFFTPIFVFDDLDCETDQFEAAYVENKTAEDRTNLRNLFEEKKSVYIRRGKVTFAIEDEGINFLEYGKGDTFLEGISLNGNIYNISYYELKKLFIISGKDLFRENIRYGLNNENYTKKKLVKNFEKYLKVGIYNCIKWKGDSVEVKEKNDKIKEILEIDDDIVSNYIPGIFWFNHNGVTIFVSGGKVDKRNSSVEFCSKDASIINGAQTMTNLYKTVNEVKKSVTKLCDKELEPVMNKSDSLDITSKNYIEHIFENICKRIYLKTIIIEGDKKYVKGISDGLNTQIPISEVDILAGSEYVYKINKILASENIRIIKEGEVENRNQISVINFAKKYKIISGIPGTSKNLNKNTVEELLQEAAGDKSISDLAKKLRIVVEADEWWTRNRKNELVKVEEDEENICKYGRNYYESYVVLHMPENTDDDVLSNIFIDFIKKAKLAKSDKVMAEFKKDELFYEIKNLYLAEKGKKIEESEKNEMIRSNLQKLTKYLNKNKESKSLSALITRFFENIGIDFENFRTIRTREEYQPLEAFPFSSSTFIDIYKNIDFTKKMEIKAFGDSKFCHEIEKNFPVFVIIIDKDGNINDVKYIENFSFIGNKSKAEKVYNDTVNAFKAGNEEDFVKESDDRGFHIRPKARTADDTFEFSNGKEITKRTFWANRNLIKDLLGEYLSKSGADS